MSLQAEIISVDRSGDALGIVYAVFIDGREIGRDHFTFYDTPGTTAEEISSAVRERVSSFARRAHQVRSAEAAAKTLIGSKIDVA